MYNNSSSLVYKWVNYIPLSCLLGLVETKHKTVKGLVYLFTNILTFLIYYRIIILKSQQNIINVKVNLKYESKVFNERF